MNHIGHPYITWKIFPEFDQDYAVGSWLPDLVPFVPNSVFTFEEIHEGGEIFLKFLQINYPQHKGLALGMLSHGVRYGADKLSRLLESKYEHARHELIQKILHATPNLTEQAASQYRFHNFLWWGIDVQIQRHEDEFLTKLKTAVPLINRLEIAKLLAECFSKSELDVRRMVDYQLALINPQRLSTVRGLAEIWQKAAAGLPEQDQVDIEKCVNAFEFCAELVASEWRQIIKHVATEVKANLRAVLSS